MQKNTNDTIKNALKYLIEGSNRVAEAGRNDPGRFSIGTQIQKGNFLGSGLFRDEVKNFVGGMANSVAPMDKIIGGAYQGKPLDVLEGGGRMLGAVQVAGLLNSIGRAPAAAKESVNQARNLFGQYSKKTGPMISDLRQATRPAHQVAIEQAIGAGNFQQALKIANSIPANDPYRQSMINLISRFTQ